MITADTRLRFTAGRTPLTALREAIATCRGRGLEPVAVWVNPTIRDLVAGAPLPVYEDANIHYWYIDLEVAPQSAQLSAAQLPLFRVTAP